MKINLVSLGCARNLVDSEVMLGRFLKQGWFLLDAERRVLLEIQPRGVFRQGAYIALHSSLEVDLVVFAYYLVQMRQQEDAAAVAATS